MSIGLFKGIGGLIGRPIKGGFDFLAQPIAGALNTPNFLYKQLTKEHDPTSVKVMNFQIFGLRSEDMKQIECKGNDALDQTTIMLKDPEQEESVYVIDDEKFGLMSNFESHSNVHGEESQMAFKNPNLKPEPRVYLDQDRSPNDTTTPELIQSWNESQFLDFSRKYVQQQNGLSTNG